MSRWLLLILLTTTSCALLPAVESISFELGEERIVPNTRPGVPLYSNSPQGGFSVIPSRGHVVAFWAGPSSFRSLGSGLMALQAPGLPVLTPGSPGEFDAAGAYLNSVVASGETWTGAYTACDDTFRDPNPDGRHWSTAALAFSRDTGRTWNKAGIFLSGKKKPNAPAQGGISHPWLVRAPTTGHWFCIYQDGGRLHLARSEAEEPAPETWKKWFRDGFKEAGLGGKSSPLKKIDSIPGGGASVHLNEALRRWVMVWHAESGHGGLSGSLWVSTSADLVDWTPPQVLLVAPAGDRLLFPTIVGPHGTARSGPQASLLYAHLPKAGETPRKFVVRSIRFFAPQLPPPGSPVRRDLTRTPLPSDAMSNVAVATNGI